MSKYKEIKGFKVQTLASDTAASGITGGTWASGGALNTTRGFSGRTGAGPQTAAQAAAGFGPPAVGNVEHYDGTSWTETTDVNTARSAATHGGIQTSSLITGGSTALAVTEEWNGSAWTEVNDLNTGRRQLAMSTNGNAEGAVAFGGYAPPTPGPVGYTGLTESWNGSSWTEVADLNTPRSSLTATDQSSTAALAIAGYRGPPTADRTKFVEEWNGSAWTEIADVNQERMDLGCAGSYTDCIIFAGTDGAVPFVGLTEHWDGSSWTEIADMATTRSEVGGTGSSTAGLVFGGTTPPYTNVTEEFTAASSFQKTNLGQVYYNSGSNAFKVTEQPVPGGSWASGPSINNARWQAGGSGATQHASWIVGGAPGTKAFHEQYDGSSWTEAADLGTAKYGVGSLGTTTAALVAGGYDGAYENDVEVWNGSSWTEVNDINTIRGYSGASGTTTAGIIYGGLNPGGGGVQAVTETWDGTNWTEVADLNTARTKGGKPSNGTQTAAIFSGGGAPSNTGVTELWNGSSWTETTDMNTARADAWGFGTSTAQLVCGGGAPYTAKTESWNGSAWTEVGDLGTASVSNNPNGGGTAGAGIIAGAYTGSASSASEEWNAAEINKTITVS
jgi:hypothetical protein